MKRLIVVVLALVAVSGFAQANGATLWAQSGENRFTFAYVFAMGYFRGIDSTVFMSEKDHQEWVVCQMASGGVDLANRVDAFYQDPENANVSNQDAIVYVLEQAIAKTPDGVRLLNEVYASVGGWHPSKKEVALR